MALKLLFNLEKIWFSILGFIKRVCRDFLALRLLNVFTVPTFDLLLNTIMRLAFWIPFI